MGRDDRVSKWMEKQKREKSHTVVKKVKYGNLLAEAINARAILTHEHAHTNK